MEKGNLLSKLNSKDYNLELERILENKEFSKNVKNLLLSMLYKIEAGFKDYNTVKTVAEDKKNYIEAILEIIENKCKKIIIVDEKSDISKEIQERNTRFIINILDGIIYLMYPNETLLLYTIYKIDDNQVYLDERYNLIRNALSALLNAGENINNIEVLRDFNGWNWNIDVKEIPDITTNIIYQNLIYLLGLEFIKDWVHTQEAIDYLEVTKNKLKELYGEDNANDILNKIYKISIIICVDKNQKEKERLLDEKETLQKEIDRLENKLQLLHEISEFKKESLKQIKQIDKMLNNKQMLEEEFIRRNKKRASYNKIFSITHLTEILNKERKKILSKIEENNKLLDPEYYVTVKNNILEQLDLLADIEMTKEEKENKKFKYLVELQEAFIKCISMQIEKAQEKEEIINLIYILRYYNNIFITEKTQIKDEESLKYSKNELETLLINKAYGLKILNRISNEETINNEIIKNLLNTKIIKLENISIELKENENALEVSFFDADIYDKTIVIPVYNKKEILVKFGKNIKIFV